MTREEVIKIYNEVLIFGKARCTQAEFKELAKMSIKALEQESVLDKIRAEIEQLTSRYTISRERGGMGQVEWSDMLIKESEVLEIIDKYKGESKE